MFPDGNYFVFDAGQNLLLLFISFIMSGNGDTSSEDFEPNWYLLENHLGTSYDNLKAGLSHLKYKATQRSDGPREFIKYNLSTFLDCYQTLSDVVEKIVEDRKNAPDRGITAPLEKVLKSTS